MPLPTPLDQLPELNRWQPADTDADPMASARMLVYAGGWSVWLLVCVVALLLWGWWALLLAVVVPPTAWGCWRAMW